MPRHWSVPQIRAELLDSRQIGLSDDAIEDALRNYQRMLAARQQDPRVLVEEYAAVNELRLSIDGLQPEKGHVATVQAIQKTLEPMRDPACRTRSTLRRLILA